MGALDDLWPLYRLRLHIGDLELRLPDDSDLAALAGHTVDPIHDPATMPFSTPWTDEPAERRALGTIQWHWRMRAEWTPQDWHLELVAVRSGEVVGTQGIHGKDFTITREVDTGSWVGRRFQSQGIGTAMRQAVLHLAFGGMGCQRARSGAFIDNGASLKVSERLGYATDGTDLHVRRGQPASMVRLLLTRDAWEARSPTWPEVTVEGLDLCSSSFGLG